MENWDHSCGINAAVFRGSMTLCFEEILESSSWLLKDKVFGRILIGLYMAKRIRDPRTKWRFSLLRA